MRESADRAPAVKSAGRALDVVSLVADNGALTALEISERLGLPRSSTHGLVHTLIDAGWLEQDPRTKAVRLGLQAWQVGRAYDGHRTLTEQAVPVMDELSSSTGETVQLARLDGVENVYIAISESPNPMRLASTVGMRLHSHATGIGKALLSTLDPSEARRRLESVALPTLTPHTVVDIDELLVTIERVSLLGYAVDDEEFITGCRCVAVPVTSAEETGVAAAMSVTMPTSRTGPEWPHALVPPLTAARARIRAGLGLD